MNQVKRAIIMAAGTGSRMNPVTLDTPKPLVRVNGTRMIDTVIQALYQNKIFEIHIVVGYLKDKFQELKKDFPDIHLIENPYYNNCNNISSLYVAREYIEDAIILDGDQIIYNSDILFNEFDQSGYNCIWTDGHTDEWLLKTNNQLVDSCSRTGGEKGWQLYSISRWTKEDGKRLKTHLELEFETNQNRQIYWDDVALFCHPEDYQLTVYEMKQGDILEIDSFDELIKIDSSYKNFPGGKSNE